MHVNTIVTVTPSDVESWLVARPNVSIESLLMQDDYCKYTDRDVHELLARIATARLNGARALPLDLGSEPFATLFAVVAELTESPVVHGRLVAQHWDHDYAVDDKEIPFLANMALDTFPLSALPPNAEGLQDGYLCWGDELYDTASELGLIRDGYGPYECCIADDDEYETYLDYRVMKDYGIGSHHE